MKLSICCSIRRMLKGKCLKFQSCQRNQCRKRLPAAFKSCCWFHQKLWVHANSKYRKYCLTSQLLLKTQEYGGNFNYSFHPLPQLIQSRYNLAGSSLCATPFAGVYRLLLGVQRHHPFQLRPQTRWTGFWDVTAPPYATGSTTSSSADLNRYISLLAISTGASQGYMFSLLLHSLYTPYCLARYISNATFKFTNNTTVIGQIAYILLTDPVKTEVASSTGYIILLVCICQKEKWSTVGTFLNIFNDS